MFVAQLSNDTNTNGQIISNLSEGKEGGTLELGRFVDPLLFKGLGDIRIEERFQSAEEIKEHEMEKISALATPSNVLGVFKKKSAYENPSLKNKITLVLDDIQDPGNLGTIIRNADWFGVENIICSKGTADAYNPKVVQSTMASLGRVQLLYTDIEDWLKKTPVKKYAAALHGKDLHLVGKPTEAIIIIGNESKGISAKILSLADEKITIPRFGSAESLNAAVATGIILYALHA